MHSSFIVFSVITASKLTQTVPLTYLNFSTTFAPASSFLIHFEGKTIEWKLRTLYVHIVSMTDASLSFRVLFEGRSISDGFLTAMLTGPNGFYQHVPIDVEHPIVIQGTTRNTNSITYPGLVSFPSELLLKSNGNDLSFTLDIQWLGANIEKQMCHSKEVQSGTNCRSTDSIAIVVSTNATNVNPNNEHTNGASTLSSCNRDHKQQISGKGAWISNRWVPKEKCVYTPFTNLQIQQCLANKEIIIFGDSHLRGVYQALLDKLSPSVSIQSERERASRIWKAL